MHSQSTTLPAFNSSYGTYLASREWALKKVAVRARSGGTCENCRRNLATQTHHLTYDRLYNERLDDLMDVCRPCHEYFSGRTHVDPRLVCCSVEEAQEWADLLADDDDPALYEAALQHLVEVRTAWYP